MFCLVLAGLLASFISTQAEAGTIRYKFDVSDSWFGINRLERVDADTTIGPEEYTGVIAAHHPLAHLIGQTGSVVFDFQVEAGILRCVSGFLCSDISRTAGTLGPGRDDPYLGFVIQGSARWWGFYTHPSGSGSLTFGSDSVIYQDVEWNGGYYYLGGDAQANFSLANMKIAPVPLPAGAPLLMAGVLVLGIGARRRRRPA